MPVFIVSSETAGERLDLWLARQFPNHSRTEVQRWIKAAAVLVDGTPAKPSHRVEAAQCVSVSPPEVVLEPSLQAEAIPLDVLYENADLLVINKPAGLVVHPAPGHPGGTLVNAVMHRCPDIEGVGGEKRPGIVHRLDKDTSGIIIVAKHDRALRDLQRQFKNRTVQKEYLALLEGRLDQPHGRITAPIGRHPTARKRQAVYPNTETAGVREAVTDYRSEAVYSASISHTNAAGHFTLVRAMPHTGRTHQLRVHFAWLKHPIVGDSLYGYKKQRLNLSRPFLHAERLRFMLPSSGESVEFHAPLPPELAALLATLEDLPPGM
jgi:23S rRNA pseudouridine1911/1915/1917 synthase